jgi:glycosyltransferase involved in cell wall biosynthesis
MKVLVNAVSAKLGGAATYVRNLARSLEDGLQHSDQFVFVVPPERARELPLDSERIKVFESGAASGSYARRWWWDQVTLRGMIASERPDVLFSSANFAMLACPCPQALLVRIPIYFSSEYLQHVLPAKSLAFRAETALRRWLVCRSVESADCVVTPSAAMLGDLRRFARIPEGRAFVNPYGVPAARVERDCRHVPSGGRPLRLLWVSHYADHKNLGTLLRAAALLREKSPVPFEIWLTLEGGGGNGQHTPMPEDERQLLAALGGSVRLLGVLEYAEIWQAYRDADLFVFPSLCESFGHPLVEAMACGLPIVASDIAIHREITGDAAEYFPVLSAEALAARLAALLADAGRREELARRGFERIGSFLWEDHVARLLVLLRMLADSPAAARRGGRRLSAADTAS